jgi:hypothetical protein
MPRFVILRHECPPGYARWSHWDLMFEVEDGLRTWAFLELPEAWRLSSHGAQFVAGKGVVVGEELGLHRLDYLTFEGPLDGRRGRVERVEEGDYRVLAESPDSWDLQLTGRGISGRLRLERDAADARYWRLEWSSD